jgi:predicted PurR-regulated permease PerM
MRSAVTLNGILLAGNAVLIPTLGGFMITAFAVEYAFFFAGDAGASC